MTTCGAATLATTRWWARGLHGAFRVKWVGCLVALTGGIAGGAIGACQECKDVCNPPYDVLGYCTVQNGTCSVDGTPIPHCAPGSCGTFDVAAGATLTVPVGVMWPALGSRDDLLIVCNCTLITGADPMGASDGSVPSGVSVLLDGVSFPGCVAPPLGGGGGGAIECSNIPKSAKSLEIRFAQGAENLSVDFQDDECDAAHPVCPQ